MKTILVFILLFAIILAFACVVALFFLLRNSEFKKLKSSKKKNTSKILDLKGLKEALKNPNLNSNELKELALIFINTQKFEHKNSKNLTQSMKDKLDFLTVFAMHPKASAKDITFLNRELNSRYSAYKSEIDAYEQMGLAKRKMRENES